MADGPINDEKMIISVLNGNTDSFGVLVEKYWHVAVAIAAAKTAQMSDAEDIAQDSFIKAYHNLASLKDRTRFAGWMSKIVSQECVNHFRRNKKANAVSLTQYKMPIPAPITSNPGLSDDQKKYVRHTIAALADKYRLVIILRFIGGFNACQIADQLGENPGTIRTRLHRAYNMLAKSLEPVAVEAEIL